MSFSNSERIFALFFQIPQETPFQGTRGTHTTRTIRMHVYLFIHHCTASIQRFSIDS